ncbi:TetR/AcrR family transcriptional regulator [Anaerocolumna chitinilytica]|uniref:HTH tetR-type domain-containing protein n=1 Tax=Anaerocolumna chitinilytica TaxID=1727145 RepID=A0A7I8DN74_9FIRM|nr:TetR/AcrR family transcriptional regulator [Anaerocolumna chitinilytica]BCJ98784.1 hypothetical protein bsdcttw_18250 [Anaerocolumna chitinilytica]
MTTKERIEAEALKLFSIHGYSGVSIRDIAGAVGIKESSIYKHYSGKEDIFKTIVSHYREKTEEIFQISPKTPTDYAQMSKEMLLAMMKMTFQTFAVDEFISRCRKLFMISSPGNEQIGNLYVQNFITEPILFNSLVFEKLLATLQVKNDSNKEDNPGSAKVMAYQFYAPVFLILQEYDNGTIKMQEALLLIEKITLKFMEVYEV